MVTLCQSCQKEKGEHSCQKCGRLICNSCWRVKICKDCSSGYT